MAVTRSTEGNESTSKKGSRTAKAAAVPEAAASKSTTAKKAAAKTAPAASKPKETAAAAQAKPKETAAAAQAKPTPETAPEAAPEASGESGTASEPPAAEVTPEQKLQMIAEAAYFRAERRGFVGGNPTEDWVAAEAEVEARLSQQK